jgi:hypothetical protein
MVPAALRGGNRDASGASINAAFEAA